MESSEGLDSWNLKQQEQGSGRWNQLWTNLECSHHRGGTTFLLYRVFTLFSYVFLSKRNSFARKMCFALFSVITFKVLGHCRIIVPICLRQARFGFTVAPAGIFLPLFASIVGHINKISKLESKNVFLLSVPSSPPNSHYWTRRLFQVILAGSQQTLVMAVLCPRAEAQRNAKHLLEADSWESSTGPHSINTISPTKD